MPPSHLSVQLKMKRVSAVFKRTKKVGNVGMIHRFPRVIGHEILLRHISYVIALVIFGEQMIERLILDRAAVLGNRFIPLFGIGKFGIDIENHAPKRVLFMTDNLAQMIFCARSDHTTALPTLRLYPEQGHFVQFLRLT